jgi:hypothetical protein
MFVDPAGNFHSATLDDGLLRVHFTNYQAGPQWKWIVHRTNWLEGGGYFGVDEYERYRPGERDYLIEIGPTDVGWVARVGSASIVFDSGSRGSRMSFAMPLYVLECLLVLVVAWMWHRTTRKHRRQNEGLCTACGYDLRASRDRCPECGLVIEHQASPPTA